MSISLIIKGNRVQARKAARQRGILVDIIRENSHRPSVIETIALAHNEDRNKIANWLAETDTAPFPIGTLLLFTDLD